MSVITPEMLEAAFQKARPLVERLLEDDALTWGPKWVSCVIIVPGMMHTRTLGKVTPWNPAWGEEKDFNVVALSKAQTAMRERMDTGLALVSPWVFEPNEYLYFGGVYVQGVAVGVSGAKGYADEAIARLIASIVIMDARFALDALKAAGISQVPDPHKNWRQ